MNPIANLTEKDFEDLDYYELLQVMNAYCDQNSYDTYFECEPKRTALRDNAVKSFENQIGNISLLETYFNFWTK